jgi:hypothetical protein
MSKYYFNKWDENCYTLEYHKDYMKENNLKELKLFEAKKDSYLTGFFFCKAFFEVGEKNNTCGKECSCYKPRNGIKGICKHYGYTYEQTDKVKILKLN